MRVRALDAPVLAALKRRYVDDAEIPAELREQAGSIYKELRKNLVGNIYREYKRTGFLWEQYSGEDGVGLRQHPFAGWTALVLLVMAEIY